MAERDGEERQLIAAEYVLGTLRGPARRRFAREIETDDAARAEVEAWERRLNALAEAAPEIAPPESVWRGIERRLDGGTAVQIVWRSVSFWRGFSAVATAAAAALLVLLVQSTEPRPPAFPTHIAVLRDAESKPAFLVRADLASRSVGVEPLRAQASPEGADYELWLVAKTESKAPESLGVMVVERTVAIPLSQAQYEALLEAAAMAVSVEPPGGSPTGLPTGDVKFKGELVAAHPPPP